MEREEREEEEEEERGICCVGGRVRKWGRNERLRAMYCRTLQRRFYECRGPGTSSIYSLPVMANPRFSRLDHDRQTNVH